MNLQQIRYLREVVKRGFNLTAAAEALHTSQPGISQRIKELEDELNVTIFVRQGKRITGLTPPGEAVLAIAERIGRDVENLKKVGSEFSESDAGNFVIAATHMQARYVLPQPVLSFTKRYPRVQLAIRQGNPRQLAEMVVKGDADVAIATETLDRFPELETLPCYRWHHCVVAPLGHPVLKTRSATLADIARYPLVTYDAAFSGRSALDDTFTQAGLETNVVLTAIDTDVIKTYVRAGLGIGIIASMAVDKKHDTDLGVIDGSRLFPEKVTKLAWRKGAYLRGYVKEFIDGFASGKALAHLKVSR
ncbi:MAG: CysB family HTH-type transcriptional regulator [Betaproteobacteria bacterium]|nr:CysB family HTH-type transcriptional regulator [Betaproteobacteria bacterium]